MYETFVQCWLECSSWRVQRFVVRLSSRLFKFHKDLPCHRRQIKHKVPIISISILKICLKKCYNVTLDCEIKSIPYSAKSKVFLHF